MKYIYNYIVVVMLALCFASCNDECENELYKQSVSFGKNGVSNIFLKYKSKGTVSYQVPVIISGSTFNNEDVQVEVALDTDTLDVLNFERYRWNKDLYFKLLKEKYYTFTPTVEVPRGESIGLLNIDFNLSGINMTDKQVLPLTIVESSKYQTNMRKHYRKALLNVIPFNDYSGAYSASAGLVYQRDKDVESQVPMTIDRRNLYVVDENSTFFYAGLIDEELTNRELYKIIAKFNDDGSLELTAPHADKINFEFKSGDYVITKDMDPQQPYLEHEYIKLNMEYSYDEIINDKISLYYLFKGSLVLERKRNTLIPDEDQQIMW